MTVQTVRGSGRIITKETLAGLGADYLAGLVFDHMSKDPSLMERLRPAIAARQARGEAEPYDNPEPGKPLMVGSSTVMLRLQDMLRRVAAANAPVLITGESGTGKELAALAIHAHSPRAAGPFIPINCAALPGNLIASELFGHEKGAFTGADQRRIGRIQAADGGTVFLDEIGDLPLELQAHLLRFLQEGTVDRVGGTHPIKVDVRVIAATNVDLRSAVADGRFREDLFYRLNVLTVQTPPLRDRGDDIDRLAAFFLRKFATEMNRPIRGIGEQAAQAIRSYSWPGNIRELSATIRRAVVMADGDWIEVADLALPVKNAAKTGTIPSLEIARRELEETMIRKLLQQYRNNITKTAGHLGISRVTLYRLISKYEIPLDGDIGHGVPS